MAGGEMTKGRVPYDESAVESLIRTTRGQRVILDTDLAGIYGVPAKQLNQQVKRNATRFPADFMFRLTLHETRNLRSQFAASSLQLVDGKDDRMNRSQIVTSSTQDVYAQSVKGMRSQIATGSSKHRDPRFTPYAFTEHGAIMAATVLNSPQAVQMSVFVVRAFVRMRQMLSTPHELARKLAELEKKLTARLDSHEVAITEVLQQIMLLLNPPPEPEPPVKQIGFHIKEKRATYRTRRSSIRPSNPSSTARKT
jgi:hypothetical protein